MKVVNKNAIRKCFDLSFVQSLNRDEDKNPKKLFKNQILSQNHMSNNSQISLKFINAYRVY